MGSGGSGGFWLVLVILVGSGGSGVLVRGQTAVESIK